jgi:predicted RNA-binding protein Jag
MNSADRKIVHDTLVEFAGIVTRSQGQDPHRRVVVALADDQPEEA